MNVFLLPCFFIFWRILSAAGLVRIMSVDYVAACKVVTETFFLPFFFLGKVVGFLEEPPSTEVSQGLLNYSLILCLIFSCFDNTKKQMWYRSFLIFLYIY